MLKILFHLIRSLFMSKEQLMKEHEKLAKEKEKLQKELKEKGIPIHYTEKDKKELELIKKLGEASKNKNKRNR